MIKKIIMIMSEWPIYIQSSYLKHQQTLSHGVSEEEHGDGDVFTHSGNSITDNVLPGDGLTLDILSVIDHPIFDISVSEF